MHKKIKKLLVISVNLLYVTCILGASAALASTAIEPKRVTLSNGITLLVVETHALPMVNVSVAIKAGSIYDPPEKAGVASLAAVLLDEGTKKRTSREIAEEVDFIGARLSTSAGAEYSSASLVVLKKDIHTGLDLLSDILTNPSFPEDEVERKKKETLAGIIASKDDPGSVASKAFYKTVFPDHPYGRPSEGDEESVARITRDDIADFYQKYYKPNNMIMAVVGDVDLDEAISLIEDHFKSWKKGRLKLPEVSPSMKLKQREVTLIDKNITQANIILGHTGISRDNPDFYAVYVMNYILGGGGFSSRLTQEIRDNQGLAYSVYSRFDINKLPGAFAVTIQTKNETARVAIDGILSELRRIREEEVSVEELEDAINYLTGSFPLKLDTNAKISSYLIFMEYYKLGLTYLEDYPKFIRAVTKEDITRVARKYLDTEKLAIIAVANQSEAGLEGLRE